MVFHDQLYIYLFYLPGSVAGSRYMSETENKYVTKYSQAIWTSQKVFKKVFSQYTAQAYIFKALITVWHVIGFVCFKLGQNGYYYSYCSGYWLNVIVCMLTLIHSDSNSVTNNFLLILTFRKIYNPSWPLWGTTYHFTTSEWKMPVSWHWTGHSGGHWQQVELCTEMVQAEQWQCLVYGMYCTQHDKRPACCLFYRMLGNDCLKCSKMSTLQN